MTPSDLGDLGDTAREAEELGSTIVDLGRRAVSTVVSIQAGPAAGLAVGVAFAAAYLLYRRRQRLARKGLSTEERSVVEIRYKIDQLYKRREELEKALEHAKRPVQRRMLLQSLQSTDSMIRDLEDVLELYNVLIEAKRRISTTLGPKAAKDVEKVLSRIEKGEEPSENIYKLLTKIETQVDRTETGIASLRLLLGGP